MPEAGNDEFLKCLEQEMNVLLTCLKQNMTSF